MLRTTHPGATSSCPRSFVEEISASRYRRVVRAPPLAARLREKLSAVLGPEYGRLLDILGGLREGLRSRFEDPAERKAVHYRLVDSDALRLIRDKDEMGLERCLDEIVGETSDQSSKMSRSGIVYIVGAGPGDPS